jgi:competence protein ComEC
VLPPLGVALTWVAGLGAAALMVLARAAAGVPGAALDLPRWAAVPLAGAVVASRLIGRSLARLAIGRPGRRPALLLLVLVPALAVLGWTRPWRSEVAWPTEPTATVLDVGQGDAILLRSPEGAAALVDAGPPGRPAPIVAALRRSGVGELGLLVLTHGSRDHAGGASALIESDRVALLAHPALGDEEGDGAASARTARSRGVATRPLAAGDRLRVGEWRLRVLWPERGASTRGDPNPRSLVVRAAAGGASLLLTADAESATLLALSSPPVGVLKVAHHGSDDPGLPRLLARLRPRAAVISAGRGNPFGHPTDDTLDALRSAAVPTWRTDRDGDVEVAVAAGRVTVGRP